MDRTADVHAVLTFAVGQIKQQWSLACACAFKLPRRRIVPASVALGTARKGYGLLEMLVACDVLRSAHQNKPDVLLAVSAWRKPVAVNACNFVWFRVFIPVNDPIDSRTSHFVSWFENNRYCPRNLRQHEPPPQVAVADREE